MNFELLTTLVRHFADACQGQTLSDFLLFPTWYEYLSKAKDPTTQICSPTITGINDVWLIVAAIFEILIRIATFMAIGFIIYGGIQYTTSQGDSKQTNAARNTITSAVIGLVICLLATTIVAFIAESFKTH